MIEIRITETPEMYGFGYELRIVDREKLSFATDMIMRQIKEEDRFDASITVPSLLHLEKQELQKWIDTLWDLGIRPSNGAGDANAIEALRGHLADMRCLVFPEKLEPKK